ncbi:MAG TPA: heme peroxidase family protein [Thermoanaerobaculia bacterium]|nr:heme peroxidase family protein [Thermoanaerobaculia bacterium]
MNGGVPPHVHGVVRGLDAVGSSPQFEGRFGRMFRTLPAAKFSEKALKDLAAAMVSESEPPTPEDKIDPEENFAISAGFTYLGQFIDHDLTFDPASSLQKQNDPDGLVDFRTPRFDLDCVYGRGPSDQPYLYRGDGIRLLQGRPLTGNPQDPKTRDVPRNTPVDGEPKRALIGDPRNDENVIVSQLQSTFLRFHNRMADLHLNAPFDRVQRLVRFYYQWVVLNDFLPTILDKDTLDSILPHLKKGTNTVQDPPVLRFYTFRDNPFIPVEFSVAAYRFGHSMVRPIYRLNTTLPERQVIFSLDAQVDNLVGFREFPSNWAIEWNLYFDFGNNPPKRGKNRLQQAYKIDSSLVNPLGGLPPSIASTIPSLAERNLLRGLRMGLPSGQDVARKMSIPVIPDNKLVVGKAAKGEDDENKPLTEVAAEFAGKAPLWYYILAEAQQAFKGDNKDPIKLGPLGSRIIGETFVGLMLGDRFSFLNQEPTWKPAPELTRNGKFGMAELITQAMKA